MYFFLREKQKQSICLFKIKVHSSEYDECCVVQTCATDTGRLLFSNFFSNFLIFHKAFKIILLAVEYKQAKYNATGGSNE